MKPFVHDGHAIVLAALRRLVRGIREDAHTPLLIIEELQSQDWASATFVGQQHRIEVRLEGGAEAVTAALLSVRDGIAEADGSSDRYFIAEAALAGAVLDATGPRATARLMIEALTLEA